jgi:NADPH-dependent curcumin reductase CurA
VKLERRLRIPNPPARALALANVTYDDGVTVWYVLSVASSGMCAYHGYKRNDSLAWGLIWAVAGAALPVVAPAIALAQGFGKAA